MSGEMFDDREGRAGLSESSKQQADCLLDLCIGIEA